MANSAEVRPWRWRHKMFWVFALAAPPFAVIALALGERRGPVLVVAIGLFSWAVASLRCIQLGLTAEFDRIEALNPEPTDYRRGLRWVWQLTLFFASAALGVLHAGQVPSPKVNDALLQIAITIAILLFVAPRSHGRPRSSGSRRSERLRSSGGRPAGQFGRAGSGENSATASRADGSGSSRHRTSR